MIDRDSTRSALERTRSEIERTTKQENRDV